MATPPDDPKKGMAAWSKFLDGVMNGQVDPGEFTRTVNLTGSSNAGKATARKKWSGFGPGTYRTVYADPGQAEKVHREGQENIRRANEDLDREFFQNINWPQSRCRTEPRRQHVPQLLQQSKFNKVHQEDILEAEFWNHGQDPPPRFYNEYHGEWVDPPDPLIDVTV